MLNIIIPGDEQWDPIKEEFVQTRKDQPLKLEHSLVSIAKWESKWCKPFLRKEPMTDEEIIDYVRCMTITQNVDPEVYRYLTTENIEQVNQYINAPMTATWFAEDKNPKRKNNSGEQVTNEIIYHWMIALNIPLEWEKRHLNRLLTLIRVCDAKNKPPKKMSKRDILKRNAALNEARRQQLNTKG
jgi:hypothetical protein